MKQKTGKIKKYAKRRHKFYFKLARPIAAIIARKMGFKYKKFPLKKGDAYFILGNHQTDMDPVFVALSFDAPVYFVAGDNIFNGSVPSKMLSHCFAPIKKRKGVADLECIRNCLKAAKEGHCICIFPEGNRAWADFQMYIDPAICKLIRLLKLPVAIYNFRGGYGVSPRWGKSMRKGRFTGEVKEVITTEDIAGMTDEGLYERVVSGLRVIDADSGEEYKSKARAEYLERELFICPKCGKISTLISEGGFIKCRECGLSAEYTERLTLRSEDKDFKFTRLREWYEFQLNKIKEMGKDLSLLPPVIYEDEGTEAFEKTGKTFLSLSRGKLALTREYLTAGDLEFEVNEIEGASIVGGGKLIINTADGKSYLIKGGKRLNVLKYILTLNILKEKPLEDKYYGLTIGE